MNGLVWPLYGILLANAIGVLSNKDINNLIEKIGIKYFVLNTEHIKYFDINSINNIVKYNTKILKEKKKLLICDNKRNNVFNNIPNIKCEMDAFSLI